MAEPLLMTQKELAAFLKVDRLTVHYWYSRYPASALPRRHVLGKRHYYDAHAIKSWLKTRPRIGSFTRGEMLLRSASGFSA